MAYKENYAFFLYLCNRTGFFDETFMTDVKNDVDFNGRINEIAKGSLKGFKETLLYKMMISIL